MAFEGAGSRVNRGRVADQILEDLRGQILSGALPPGEKLPAERELAVYYGVSGPTIRESIRVLTAIGLVDTRSGSGSVVTAQVDKLIAISIASIVQFEHMGPGDVFGILSVLNAYAAELAAVHASPSEISSFREAAERAAVIETAEQIAADLKRYFLTLAEISHNPLLAAICRFITEVQMGLALELSGGDVAGWRQITGDLHDKRMSIVDALESRDPARAGEEVRKYHELVIDRVKRLRRAREKGSDASLVRTLSSWLGAHVTLGNTPRKAG